MFKIKKLKKDRADKAKVFGEKRTAYNALVDKAERTDAESATMAALSAELDTMEAEIVAIDGEIAHLEADARRQALLTSSSHVVLPNGAVRFRSSERDPEATGGFHSLAEFARAVITGNPQSGATMDTRLSAGPTNFQQNSGAGGEGFLVPDDFRQEIWQLVFSDDVLLNLVPPPVPTAGNGIALAADESTPWSSQGIQAYWRAEGTPMTPTKLALTGKRVPLHELYALVAATEEVLEDAPLLQNRISVKAAQALAWKIKLAIFSGDGTGKPQGMMNSPALIVQAKESGQAAATIVLNNLVKMRTRMMSSSLGKSVWLMTSEVEPQLVSLSIGNMPIFVPAYTGARDGYPIGPNSGFNLMGRPAYYLDESPTLGAQGDIMLVDPSDYMLINKAGKSGPDFAASIHLWFDYNVTAFRWIVRIGGQPMMSAPITPANGSAVTKSHTVTLQAR